MHASKTDITVLLRTLQKEKNDNIVHLKNRMHKRLCILGAMVTQCYSSESLLAAEKFLNSAKCAMKALNRTGPNNFLQVQPHEPSNKHIIRRCSFYSTKKRRKKALVRIAKPTQEEKKEICSALLQRTLLLGRA